MAARTKELSRMSITQEIAAGYVQTLEVRLMSDGRREERATLNGRTSSWKIRERGGSQDTESFRKGYELCGYSHVE